MKAIDWLIILGLGFGFGAVFYFNEILLRDLAPLTISACRIGLGALAVWAVIAVRRIPVRLTALQLGQCAVFGVFMFAVPFAVYPLSQQHITSGLTGIVNAMTPVAVVIVSQFWPGGERATWAKSIGVVFGFAGIVVLSLPGLQAPGSSETLAIAFTLLGPLSYAVAFNFVRRLAGLDVAVLTAVSQTGATLVLLPLVLGIEGIPHVTHMSTIFALLVQGPILTGLFFLATLWMMRRVGATTSSTITFIAPVSALFLGWALLGEHVGPSHLLGMGSIFVGLILIDGRLIRFGKNSQPIG